MCISKEDFELSNAARILAGKGVILSENDHDRTWSVIYELPETSM